MKNILGQGPVIVVPPDAPPRANVQNQPSPIAAPEPARFHVPRQHDLDQRATVAAGERLQRVRSRLMQPRTAVDTHVRTPRRPRGVN